MRGEESKVLPRRSDGKILPFWGNKNGYLQENQLRLVSGKKTRTQNREVGGKQCHRGPATEKDSDCGRDQTT